jgi:hypothetical protein
MKLAKNLTATRLRLMLSASLAIISVLGVTLIYFANDYLSKVAVEVSHTYVDATASQDNLTTLEKVQTILKENSPVINRASSIVADSQSYQYQDQIITDLNDFAGRTGVTITNVSFSGGTAGAATPAQPVPGGLKSTSVVATLKTPVDYYSLLRFIEAVEQNLTKMQISRVSLSKGTATGNDVTSDALTIEVYIR